MEARVTTPEVRARTRRRSGARRASRVALLALAPATVGAAYLLAQGGAEVADALFYLFLWGAASTAWSIQAGISGRLSLGHQAFFGIGAYSAALIQESGGSIWLAIAFAVALSLALGAAVELVTGRLSGIYYALATFALAELVWLIARTWTGVTHGTAGVSVSFEASVANLTFTDTGPYVVVAGVLCWLCVAIHRWILGSRAGYFARALRDSEPAAVSVGIAPARWRALTGAVSTALTALAGVVYLQYVLYADPDSVLAFSVLIFIMLPSLVGGVSATYGAIVGAAIVIPLRQVMVSGADDPQSSALQFALFGLALVVIALFAKDGLIAVIARIVRRVRDWWTMRPESAA